MKIICKHVTHPISKLVNLSFKLVVFPISFKTSRVIPLQMKGPSENVANFRPISFFPYTNTFFKRCQVSRLGTFFDKTSFLSKFRLGFQKRKSTAGALVHISETIFNSLNARKQHSIVWSVNREIISIHLRTVNALEKMLCANNIFSIYI